MPCTPTCFLRPFYSPYASNLQSIRIRIYAPLCVMSPFCVRHVRYVLPSRGCSESCHTHTVSLRCKTYTGTLICQLLTETEAQSHRDSSQELRDTETSQGLRGTSKHTYNLYECINHPYEYKGNRKAQDTHYITIFQIHMLPINSRRSYLSTPGGDRATRIETSKQGVAIPMDRGRYNTSIAVLTYRYVDRQSIGMPVHLDRHTAISTP